MAGWALKLVFVVCCPAPFIVGALQVRGARASVCWCAAALLAAVLSQQADPLAVALQQVDGTVLRAGCADAFVNPGPQQLRVVAGPPRIAGARAP